MIKPEEFKVNKDHRIYCSEKWGYPFLADVFITPFLDYWKDKIEDGSPPKWKNPHMAFKRWIRMSSPGVGHSFYNPVQWEKAIELAKQKQGLIRQRKPHYDVTGKAEPDNVRPMPGILKNLVDDMRNG